MNTYLPPQQNHIQKHFKPIALLILCITAVALYFWLGSRYPALNLKAAMGQQTAISGLGFDTLLDTGDHASFSKKVLYTTINWMYTNLYGMTFGLVFAPLILTLFSVLRLKSPNNSFKASLHGVLLGLPLGVCANCATPIAHGLYTAKLKIETVLALIVSSPSLNIIVLTMMLSMLPLHFLFIKLTTVFIIVALVIPLLSKVAKRPHRLQMPLANAQQANAVQMRSYSAKDDRNWLTAARWVTVNVALNFVRITRATVPLMALAGFLGAFAITLLPASSLAALTPSGVTQNLALLAITASIGAFLPVPIAFDVIAVAILHEMGLEPRFSVALLITLGCFSIYPYLVIARVTSYKFASLFAISIVALGIIGGVATALMEPRLEQWQRQHLYNLSAAIKTAPHQISYNAAPVTTTLGTKLTPNIAPELILESAALRITARPNTPHSTPEPGSKTLFQRIYGPERGLDSSYQISAEQFTDKAFFRSIASGDVDNDGFADILLTDSDGLKLFMNLHNGHFRAVSLANKFKPTRDFISIAALVDLNNDSHLDIVAASQNEGLHWYANSAGEFITVAHPLQNNANAIVVSSLAFADINHDRRLDIVVGNWSIGDAATSLSLDTSRNALLLSDGADTEFKLHSLGCEPGETLTSLISDIDNDNQLDLLIGNDFIAPDCLYLGRDSDNFSTPSAIQKLLPKTSLFSMSYTSGDINNDSRLDIYSTDITLQPTDAATNDTAEALCAQYSTLAIHFENCIKIRRLTQAIAEKNKTGQCSYIADNALKNDCIVSVIYKDVLHLDSACDALPSQWDEYKQQCQTAKRALALPHQAASSTNLLEPLNRLNIASDIGFNETANSWGVGRTGWAWNAQFADLNNDSWLDLYISNGSHHTLNSDRNQLFINDNGRRFSNQSESSGADSLAITPSFTYLDLDNDGDLDIVTNPLFGPTEIYINASQGNSISFSLHDTQGHTMAIGSKIKLTYGNGKHQMRELKLSGGYASFNQAILHFGLADHTQIDHLEIVWPDAKTTQVALSLAANHHYQIERR